jgi:hypothetical protein
VETEEGITERASVSCPVANDLYHHHQVVRKMLKIEIGRQLLQERSLKRYFDILKDSLL